MKKSEHDVERPLALWTNNEIRDRIQELGMGAYYDQMGPETKTEILKLTQELNDRIDHDFNTNNNG